MIMGVAFLMQTGKPIWWDPAIKYLQNDPIIGPLISQYPDKYLEGGGDIFSSLIHAVVGQQISIQAASSIKEKLLGLVGEFSQEVMKNFSQEQMAQCGLTRNKARCIFELTHTQLSLIPDNYNQMTDQELIKYYCQFWGIGPWTSEMILIFTFMRPDIFSIGDIGLINAVRDLVPNLQSKEEILRFSQENWSPYQTAASWYLWRHLDEEVVAY
ncbi:MAG: DNA-3-methyladenine glycosylase [Euryarchaeota archaeon]|nr:DNA-3-methyladenine glycosylase [Euryarchaeota archaeon]|tara:strand:- start:631 stop:1269 length:639 start_codon:yes stop_codon:yes gene_type:complete